MSRHLRKEDRKASPEQHTKTFLSSTCWLRKEESEWTLVFLEANSRGEMERKKDEGIEIEIDGWINGWMIGWMNR